MSLEIRNSTVYLNGNIVMWPFTDIRENPGWPYKGFTLGFENSWRMYVMWRVNDYKNEGSAWRPQIMVAPANWTDAFNAGDNELLDFLKSTTIYLHIPAEQIPHEFAWIIQMSVPPQRILDKIRIVEGRI